MNFTFSFQDPLASRLELSGGKGSNLAILTQRGFPVPPGFIITAQVYRDFIADAGELLRGVNQLPFHDAGLLRAESAKLREALALFPLPATAATKSTTN
jgi:pyruvate,water dikinase